MPPCPRCACDCSVWKPRGSHALSDEEFAAVSLLKAVTDGDIPAVRRLAGQLKRTGKGVEEVLAAIKSPEYRHGPLHIAALAGKVEMCKFLIKHLDLNADAPGHGGPPPLCYAIYGTGSIPVVRLLLDRGANPNKTASDGISALHYCAMQGAHPGVTENGWAATNRDFCGIAELLLSRGAYVDLTSEVGTPLHAAAQCGHARMLELLLRHQANPNRVVRLFYTPLALAIYASSLECVELLIKAGAEVNAGRPITPLVIAATYGFTDCIKCLLEAGADANIPDEIGRMPVEIAAFQGWKECVEILFPFTSPVARHTDWSIAGVIQHAKCSTSRDPELYDNDALKVQGAAAFRGKDNSHASTLYTKDTVFCENDALKVQGNAAFQEQDYDRALTLYTKAMGTDHDDSTLYAKRSLCWLHMGKEDKALDDGNTYKDMELNLTDSCYEQAAALILTKEYGQACKALLSGLKLDFGSDPTGEASGNKHT